MSAARAALITVSYGLHELRKLLAYALGSLCALLPSHNL
jgi:hypothetical protein